MKEHYVSFEQGQALKRLGFKEEVTHYYTPEDAPKGKAWFTFSFTPCDHNHQPPKGVIPKCSAPRLDQAQAWLREVKGFDIEVTTVLRNPIKKSKCYMSNISYFSKDIDGNDCCNYVRAGIGIHSYENALSIGINKALELLGKEVNNA